MDNLDAKITPSNGEVKTKHGKILKIALGIMVLIVLFEGSLYFYLSRQRRKSQTTVPYRPIGEQSIGEDGVTSVWLLGSIVSSPYLKDSSYFLPLVFKEKGTRLEADLLLGEEKGMVGSFIKESDSGKVEGERTLHARQISEVLPFLQSGISVKFQIATGFDKDKFAIYKENIACDDSCLKKVALLEKYTQGNREFVKLLDEGKKAEKKIIGPVIQIEILGTSKND